MIDSQIEDLRTWRSENPLRKWRTENDVSIANASVLLGASTSSIQGWESGTTTPNPDSFAALASVLGKDIRERWDAWTTSLDKKVG